MIGMSLTQQTVSRFGSESGFDLTGAVALPLAAAGELRERVEEFVGTGRAGKMEYLKRKNDEGELLRASATNPFLWARSMIVCAANYNADAVRSIDAAPGGAGWIARYAWSGKAGRPSDYHKVLRRRLEQMDAGLKAELGEFESRCFVDTGPIVERAHAVFAGLGWVGKNTCLIHPQLGSWVFLGVILTSLEVEEPALTVADRCGSCTRCMDACPTGALIAPYRMDANRCIAYLTIEEKGSSPELLRKRIGRQVFGCDICQDVCPWNRKAPVARDEELSPREQLVNPSLLWLASLDEAQFGALFNGSPVRRAGFDGLRRNLAVAIGNARLTEAVPALRLWSREENPALREAAEWALAEMAGATERSSGKT
jgi:epoxyqueuosine reductase